MDDEQAVNASEGHQRNTMRHSGFPQNGCIPAYAGMKPRVRIPVLAPDANHGQGPECVVRCGGNCCWRQAACDGTFRHVAPGEQIKIEPRTSQNDVAAHHADGEAGLACGDAEAAG